MNIEELEKIMEKQFWDHCGCSSIANKEKQKTILEQLVNQYGYSEIKHLLEKDFVTYYKLYYLSRHDDHEKVTVGDIIDACDTNFVVFDFLEKPIVITEENRQEIRMQKVIRITAKNNIIKIYN